MFFLGGFLNYTIAQNITITGKVKNKATGEVLVGATVNIEKTTKSSQTDASGNFSISAPKGSVLVISYVGMVSQRYSVSKGENITISLEEASKSLDDIVVVGYGTQKVTKVSGAISTVKSADIEKLKPVRAEEALQGRASGVTVIQNGSPGSKPTVLVRGIPSFSGTDPLVIIDGIQQTLDDLNSINPTDIESLNVLKDAATTAIYGVRGGNGVIVVTTKTGRKNQKTEINVTLNYGVQQVINKVGVLNASEYAGIINEGSTLSGGNIIFPDLSKVGVGVNWQDQVFKTAPIQNHNITFKGGAEKSTYFLSGGFLEQGGVIGGIDKSRFRRGNFTSNLSFDLSSKLKLFINTSGVYISSKGVAENNFNSVLGNAINYDPTVPLLNNVPNTIGKNGFSTLLRSEIINPLTQLDNTYNITNGGKVYGKFEFQYEILKNLKLTNRFGYTYYNDKAKAFYPLVFYGLGNAENSFDELGNTVNGKHNGVSHNTNTYYSYLYEIFANYNFKLKNDHNFETVAGMTLSKSGGNGSGASRQDVPFNSWDFADYSAATGVNTATNLNAQSGYYYQFFRKNVSYFGRVNYDYKEKYLASFSARADGSYAFGKENKFANFYSTSLGWIASKEDFFNSKTINFLKIRGSYGTVGNENVSPQYVRIINGGPDYNRNGTGNSNGYTFGDVFYTGSTIGSAANNALSWEKQTQLNAGFEMTLLKNKLSITADYYEKKVEGLLFVPSGSAYLGTVPLPSANIGSTKSSGIDVMITYNETIGKKLKLSNTLTITTIKNEVTATNQDGTARILGGYYFNGQTQNITVFEKGFSPAHFVGFKTDGLFQNQSQIAASPTQNANTAPGDIKYVDVNGDGKITDADKTEIGNPFPKLTMGWNLNIEYKNFDFTMFTYLSLGNDIFRAYERNAVYTNKDRSVLARWTGEGTTNNAKNPRYIFTDPNSNIRVSDRYVEDASFVKIKNIQLGYTFPASFTKNVFSKLRVYLQVRNAFIFTKYAGFDPELGNGSIMETGVDRGAYPQPRTFAFGLDIKL
jgi:TonB-linked SusC/RagA family outer membrane protein